jgi:hypothetical protein
VNDGRRQPSALAGLHDLFEDGGGDDDEQSDVVLGPGDVEIFLNVAYHMDQDDVLFGNPKWLENFKEMKQAAIDPLYEGCPKHLMVLRFNLQTPQMVGTPHLSYKRGRERALNE